MESDCFKNASPTVPKGHFKSVLREANSRLDAMNSERVSTKPKKLTKAERKRMRKGR